VNTLNSWGAMPSNTATPISDTYIYDKHSNQGVWLVTSQIYIRREYLTLLWIGTVHSRTKRPETQV